MDEPVPDGLTQASEPAIRRGGWHVSAIWIVPVVSALIGASLIVRHTITNGPGIKVSFQNAEGLEAAKTQVKYLDVPIGNVQDIALSDDRSHVVVSIDLLRTAKSFARSDTRFWVVKPRVGISGISGIGTLLSGTYIGVDPGRGGSDQTSFTGLEKPPAITSESHGSVFNLHSADLGSLDIGSPVYYRRLRVGRVVRYALDDDGHGVTVGVFIDAPNDRFVTPSTRFWNASGIDVTLGADGLKLSTQSLTTVAAGGVAFLNPLWAAGDPGPATAGTRFELLKDETAAMERPRGAPVYVSMKFTKSLRGLGINAPVELAGVDIGKVVSVSLDYDPDLQRFPIMVGAVLYPERLGRIFNERAQAAGDGSPAGADVERRVGTLFGGLVAHGLRAQPRSGNLLTGQLYIAIDFVRNAPRASFDPDAHPLQIPTAPGTLDDLQEQVSSIVAKIDTIPFESIGHRLDRGMGQLDDALGRLDKDILPQASRTLDELQGAVGGASGALAGDSVLGRSIDQTLEELRRSARSVRAFTDYLSRHPESLIRGRRADPAEPATRPRSP